MGRRSRKPVKPREVSAERPADDDASPIEPLLEPGEKILWAGQPDPSVHFSRTDLYLAPFTVIVLAAGILWAGSVGALGWILIILGVYMVAGRFFWKAHRKRLTYYAVSNRRIVRLAGNKGKAQPFAEIPAIKFSVRSSGVGSIRFSDRPGFTAIYQNSGMEWISLTGSPDEIAFYDIPNAREVHELVTEHFYRARGLSPPSAAGADAEPAPSGGDEGAV